MTKQPEEKSQKTPKSAENSGSMSAAEFFRSKGHKVKEVPYGDSAKVRIPFPTQEVVPHSPSKNLTPNLVRG